MRQVGADQYQIAIRIITDAVADESTSLALCDQRQFVFRMKMPFERPLKVRLASVDERRLLGFNNFLNSGLREPISGKCRTPTKVSSAWNASELVSLE